MPVDHENRQIRERAYELWEHEGRPHGRHLDHWIQAERELGSESAGVARSSEGNASPLREAESNSGADGGLGVSDSPGNNELGGAFSEESVAEKGESQRSPSTTPGQRATEKPPARGSKVRRR
jgi:hypothetical protein